MDIKVDAPAIAHCERAVAALPEVIFATIADVAAWPSWNPDVRAASIAGPFTVGTRFQWKAGPGTITSMLQDIELNRRIVWTGTTLGIQAIHVYELTAEGDRTLVTTRESWEGILVRLFRRRMQAVLQRGLESALDHLEAEAERRARLEP